MKTMRIFLYCCAAVLSFMVLNIDFISGEEIERDFATNSDYNLEENLNRVKRNNGRNRNIYRFNATLRRLVVNELNKVRRNVRPRAANMRELSWDNDLAEMALSHSARRCRVPYNKPRGDSCFDVIDRDPYCLIGVPFGDFIINKYLGSTRRSNWNFQSNTCNSERGCQRFKIRATADTYKVGCGATHCSTQTVLVCYFGGPRRLSSKPYIPGRPCSRCSDRSDTCKRGLCFKRQRTAEDNCSNFGAFMNAFFF